jgi:hypothetical protein
MQTRRGLITGLISLVAAPAIIRVNHLMPISVPKIIARPADWVTPEFGWTQLEQGAYYTDYIRVDKRVYDLYKEAVLKPNPLISILYTNLDEEDLT